MNRNMKAETKIKLFVTTYVVVTAVQIGLTIRDFRSFVKK